MKKDAHALCIRFQCDHNPHFGCCGCAERRWLGSSAMATTYPAERKQQQPTTIAGTVWGDVYGDGAESAFVQKAAARKEWWRDSIDDSGTDQAQAQGNAFTDEEEALQLLLERSRAYERRIYCRLCIVAAVGLALQLYICEESARVQRVGSGLLSSTGQTLVKACISLLTLMLVALLYQYYSQLLRTSILRMRHDFEDTLFGTNFGEWFLLEAVVCLVHSPPFLSDGTYELVMPTGSSGEDEVLRMLYNYDAIITVVVMGRCYLLFRLFHCLVGKHGADMKFLAAFYSVDNDPWFTFRLALNHHTFGFVSLLAVLWAVLCAYALRVAELPINQGYVFVMDCVWSSVVTMTTVGFGDIFPVSHPGRLVGVVSAFAGTVMLALLITAVEIVFGLDEAEKRVVKEVRRIDIKRRVKNAASRVISALVRARVLQCRYAHHQKIVLWNKSKVFEADKEGVLKKANGDLLVAIRYWRIEAQKLRALLRNNQDSRAGLVLRIGQCSDKLDSTANKLRSFAKERTEWQARANEQMEQLMKLAREQVHANASSTRRISQERYRQVATGQRQVVVESPNTTKRRLIQSARTMRERAKSPMTTMRQRPASKAATTTRKKRRAQSARAPDRPAMATSDSSVLSWTDLGHAGDRLSAFDSGMLSWTDLSTATRSA